MPLGFKRSSGDFLPIVKYDARAGRFFRRDRIDNDNNEVDITSIFKAVFDMANIEVGYMLFMPNQAPEFHMVRAGEPYPQEPQDGDWKQGFRIVVKLAASCAGSIPDVAVREFCSTANVVKESLEALHVAYFEGLATNPDKLPVVVLKDVVAVTSKGKTKTTNYGPVFAIEAWVTRPADLVAEPRGMTSPPSQMAMPLGRPMPPATGSTAVKPPAPRLAVVPASTTAPEDFG